MVRRYAFVFVAAAVSCFSVQALEKQNYCVICSVFIDQNESHKNFTLGFKNHLCQRCKACIVATRTKGTSAAPLPVYQNPLDWDMVSDAMSPRATQKSLQFVKKGLRKKRIGQKDAVTFCVPPGDAFDQLIARCKDQMQQFETELKRDNAEARKRIEELTRVVGEIKK